MPSVKIAWAYHPSWPGIVSASKQEGAQRRRRAHLSSTGYPRFQFAMQVATAVRSRSLVAAAIGGATGF